LLAVDKKNFEEEVLQFKGVAVVDFWSQKCEPCKALMPEVEELAARYEGKAKFCKLDTGGNRRLAISQKVMGLPTIAFYKDGEKVAEFSKEFSMEEVEKKLQELI
jgi:thioredoxin 1